jgi:hypothetical protein
MTDARYWTNATPRKIAFCPAKRRPSRRTTPDAYRSEGARMRRRAKREYRKSGLSCGFKRWLLERVEAA